MFWMIVVAVMANSGPARLMADPVVAFTSEGKCQDAVLVLQKIKTNAPLQCVSFEVIGGVPLDSY